MTVSDRGRRACFAPGGTPIIATVRKQRSHDAWGDHESSTVRAAAAGGQARQLSRKLTKNRKLAIKRQLLRIVLVDSEGSSGGGTSSTAREVTHQKSETCDQATATTNCTCAAERQQFS
ncbi:hypothetical protein V498_07391 [Pseudogymnoascus sp. VKM F-4517 (FW-2822)]|nr:hypothetical protein V498_07391 [Pseudogymnoascus sp. VKM F-4517 (FW-2822)]